MLMTWAEWLRDTALAQKIQESAVAFPWLECVHVVAIALVLGVIMIVDLRLLNVASRSYRVTRLMRTLLPLTWAAFAVALVTGSLLFLSQPTKYLLTVPFQIKMGLLALAGLNMAIFHVWTQRGIAVWDDGVAAIPLSARLAGLISIILWVGIAFAGRFIGFMVPY
jgi:hypothetical protein